MPYRLGPPSLPAFAFRARYATRGSSGPQWHKCPSTAPPPPAGVKHAVSPGWLSVPPEAPRQAHLPRPQLQTLTSAPTSLRSGIGEEKQNEETPENRSGTRAAQFLQCARRAALTAQAAGRGPAGPWRRTASWRSGRKPRLGKRPAPHFRHQRLTAAWRPGPGTPRDAAAAAAAVDPVARDSLGGRAVRRRRRPEPMPPRAVM